jgi:TolA-binding protein
MFGTAKALMRIVPVLLSLCALAAPVFAQYEAADAMPAFFAKYRTGLELYREGRWMEAAAELRSAQETAEDDFQWTEALYWLVLTEIAASDYGSAVRDMDDLEHYAPDSGRAQDMLYHRARAYYYLGYYEDAIALFKEFADRAGAGGESRTSAAYFWIGECLFAMGQLDRARDVFTLIVDRYPHSHKYEASSYRLDLIRQKKIEIELLSLLQSSRAEALRNAEEYRQREQLYEEELNAARRQLAESFGQGQGQGQGAGDVSAEAYRKQLADVQERLRQLESRLDGIPPLIAAPAPTPANAAQAPANTTQTTPANAAQAAREAENGAALKDRALQLKAKMERQLETLKNGGPV